LYPEKQGLPNSFPVTVRRFAATLLARVTAKSAKGKHLDLIQRICNYPADIAVTFPTPEEGQQCVHVFTTSQGENEASYRCRLLDL
jgi:hypothetical protein